MSRCKGKLDSRGTDGIFVGYAEEAKGYRVWIPDRKKTVVVRDVKFLKTASPQIKERYESFCDDYSEMHWMPAKSGHVNRDGEHISMEEEAEWEEEGKREEVEEEESINESKGEATVRRVQERPSIIRTGLRGSPRKQYRMVTEEANFMNESECIFLSEIPMKTAIASSEAEEWRRTIRTDITLILKNNTWTLIDRPENAKVIGSRIVLRHQYISDGTLDRRKARLVAQGFAQQPGVDFVDTFALVARLSSVRLIASLAARNNMIIRQFDVATVYFNGNLTEHILMECPKELPQTLKEMINSEAEENLKEKTHRM